MDKRTAHPDFWTYLDRLLAESQVVVDRPRGSSHPRFPELVYPHDYGYLDATCSMDGAGIDLWIGTSAERDLVGILCTVDLEKRDAEIKLLLGCTGTDIFEILAFLRTGPMQAELLLRPGHDQHFDREPPHA